MKTKNLFKAVLVGLFALGFSSVSAQVHKHHKTRKHHFQVRYAKLPHWGYAYKELPRGAYSYPHAGARYHYYQGVFYKPIGKTYVIVRPPLGMKVKQIPAGHVHFRINGRNYFYYYGTFYVKSASDVEYVVIVPPVGARVDALPEGYQKVIIDENTYYEFEGTYYKAILDHQGEVWYEVVGES